MSGHFCRISTLKMVIISKSHKMAKNTEIFTENILCSVKLDKSEFEHHDNLQ